MNSDGHVLEDPFLDPDLEVVRTRRNLPHWNQLGKLYFVTWRLADSLPKEVLARIETDRRDWQRQHGDIPLSAMG
ncbi:MAG TPA: hypothetical protein PLC20_07915, partial [Flavobacteriales bacterium]|nr:hypothetical protein [Flavobacteriales bacterium]